MLSRVPRAADLPVRIGLFPSGPTASVVDVPGVGVGHTTVWRDEDPPPAGRGVARTGVTVLDVGGNMFRSPVPAGGAVLNGAGECTGFLSMREWGTAETPVFLTSTMQVGRVLDAACELLVEEDPTIGVDDVVIPLVAECDDSDLNDSRRTQVSKDDVRAALAAARASARSGVAPPEGAVGAGTGMTCLGYKGGIGTSSRVVPAGHTVGALVLTNFGDQDRLTIAGRLVGKELARSATTGPATQGRASSCSSQTRRWTRLPAPGWPAGPGSAWPAPAAPPTTAAARSSSRWRPGCARRAASGRPGPRSPGRSSTRCSRRP